MKKFIIFAIAVFFVANVLAQAPLGITHQAVIRNSQGELVTNQAIGIRVSILQGSEEGTAVYVETHNSTCNAHGLITYVIGQGTNVSGTFVEIDWANGPYFLKTEADPTGGTNYTITGTMQFLSVPYAFYAGNFTTIPPKVIALEATEITHNSATTNGIVNAEGFLTEVVFEWGETTDYGNTVTAIQSPVKGSTDTEVSVLLEELMAETTYHYRIIASNAVDVAYSENNFFLTDAFDLEPGTVVDVDGNIYVTVVIGEQEWMAENLKVTKYNNGEVILTGLTNENWGSTTHGAYSIMPHEAYSGLNTEEEVVEAYGLLYNWYAVNDSRGICPTGWHMPSEIDWSQLLGFVDLYILGGNLTQYQLRHLTSCSVSHPRFFCIINGCTNFFGFNGTAGGMRSSSGSSGFSPCNSGYWSTLNISSNGARSYIFHCINNGLTDVLQQEMNKNTGFSIRCVKNLD